MNTDELIESYVKKAEDLFADGFNCAQAVFAACAQLFGIDEQTALRLSASFGGGMGRMHYTCGAASAMFMLEGLCSGSATPRDTEGKMNNYVQVRQLADSFRNTFGSITCSELLAMGQGRKTPCKQLVAGAVRIFLHKNAYLFADMQ